MSERLSWEDRINPVTLKELRHVYLGNKLIIGSLGSAFVMFFLGFFYILMNEERLQSGNVASLESGFSWLGAVCFFSLITMLMTSVYSPLLHAYREEQLPEQNLMNYTCLTPWQIVRGRMMALLLLIGYGFSFALPVLALMHMEGTVNAVAILKSLALFFSLIVLLSSLLLYVVSYRLKINAVVFFFGVLWMIPFFSRFIIFSIKGVFDYELTVPFLVLSLFSSGIFLVLSVVRISAPKSNALLLLKGYLTFFMGYLLSSVLYLHYVRARQSDTGVNETIILMLALLLIVLLVSCVQLPRKSQEHISLLMRDRCPPGQAGRVLYYVFSDISGGSLVWCASWLVLATLLIGFHQDIDAVKQSESLNLFLLNASGYVLFYMALTTWLGTKFKIDKKTILAGVGVLFNAVPLLIHAIALAKQRFEFEEQESVQLEILWHWMTVLSPLHYLGARMGDVFWTGCFWLENYVGVWLGVLGVLTMMPSVWRQLRDFHRITEAERRAYLGLDEVGEVPC